MLVQYDLNNFSFTIVGLFNLLKKHKTLLVWPTKVLRRWTMSSPSRRDEAMIWPTWENRSTLCYHLVSNKEATFTHCIVQVTPFSSRFISIDCLTVPVYLFPLSYYSSTSLSTVLLTIPEYPYQLSYCSNISLSTVLLFQYNNNNNNNNNCLTWNGMNDIYNDKNVHVMKWCCEMSEDI